MSYFENFPLVSVCTPTFNRRPFFPNTIKCFLHQDYPLDRMEWIIIDDGSDPIGDLVKDIPQVKYFYYPDKMRLGKKRNTMHQKCSGEIIIYMDDDDYYPPQRVPHAVDTLLNNIEYLCAGSSAMHIYFKHSNQMYCFGPYRDNHATAATFAFRRKMLDLTSYNDTTAISEEKAFLKNWTIPIIQLDPMKTILVFSHIHNTFDKKELLQQPDSKYRTLTDLKVEDFIKDEKMRHFFMVDIDNILSDYEKGELKHKPDVVEQKNTITEQRKQRIEKEIMKQQFQHEFQLKETEYKNMISDLKNKNIKLEDKAIFLESKVTHLITQLMALKKEQNHKDKIIKSV